MDSDPEEYRRAKNYALRRLSMQAILSNQLAVAMRKRLIPEEIIDRVLNELTTLGLLNDEEWAASFVRTQSQRKMGPRAIAQKLASKGVRGADLTKAIEGAGNVEDQKSKILQLLQTRFSKRNLSDPKEKRRVVAALVRRGFDLSLIFGVISQIHGRHGRTTMDDMD